MPPENISILPNIQPNSFPGQEGMTSSCIAGQVLPPTLPIHQVFHQNVDNMTKSSEETSKGKMEYFEERLRAVEGADVFGSIDASKLYLILNIVIPAKFKVPDFEKYDGTSCPKSHLIMYCRKMAAYVNDEKMLIHVFQDSLTGVATRWYM